MSDHETVGCVFLSYFARELRYEHCGPTRVADDFITCTKTTQFQTCAVTLRTVYYYCGTLSAVSGVSSRSPICDALITIHAVPYTILLLSLLLLLLL